MTRIKKSLEICTFCHSCFHPSFLTLNPMNQENRMKILSHLVELGIYYKKANGSQISD